MQVGVEMVEVDGRSGTPSEGARGAPGNLRKVAVLLLHEQERVVEVVVLVVVVSM